MQNYPWRFLPMAGWSKALAEVLRSVVNWTQLRTSRRVGRAARRAALLLTCNSENQQAFARIHGVAPRIHAGNGVARLIGRRPDRKQDGADREQVDPEGKHGDPLRLLWVGAWRASRRCHWCCGRSNNYPRSSATNCASWGRDPSAPPGSGWPNGWALPIGSCGCPGSR